MTEFRHRKVMVENASIHVVEGGIQDHPVIVFLHGWRENWTAFRQVMVELRDGFHVVALDFPGIGESIGAASLGG